MGNEVEMDEKYTPYNHKGTKIDGVAYDGKWCACSAPSVYL